MQCVLKYDMKKFLFLIIFVLLSLPGRAQSVAIGTNVVDYLNLGTINLEGSVAVSRNWTLEAEWDYNPWTYNEGKADQFQNRSVSGSLGTRWWPWHVYAGWWLKGGLQYQVYNHGGLLSETSEEGESYGGGLAMGYALLLGEKINLDFGFGIWGGKRKYVTYRCTNCGRMEDQGEKWFLLPDDITISLYYIF